jgi:hypothetical protein
MRKTAGKRLALSDLIRRFSISFRLRPAYGSVAGEGPEIGCEVELIGRHYAMGKHRSGGCAHCLEVLLALLELHDRTLSGERHPYAGGSISDQCEKLIHYASTGGDWPEVVLDVKIIRRPNLQQVSEEWVISLNNAIRKELLDLGCCEIPSVYMPAELVSSRGLSLVERAV